MLQAYKNFPPDEKFGMVSQIRRKRRYPSILILQNERRVNRKMKEKILWSCQGSVIEIDAALDIAKEVNYLDNYTFDNLGETMIRTFKILTRF